MSLEGPFTRRDFAKGLAAFAASPRGPTFDVVITGAGVFGTWIAIECRARGWSVLLLDGRGPANSSASSGGESRILRVGYGPQSHYSRWALASLSKWEDALRRAHSSELFLKNRVLWIGPTSDPYLVSMVDVLHRLNVALEVLDAKDLRKRYSNITPERGDVGLLEHGSGTILARRAVQSLVEFAISQGVIYRTRQVLRPRIQGRLESIETAEGDRISAEKFIFACGPWLPKLFPEVIASKIQSTRQEVFFFAPPAGDSSFEWQSFPSWVDFRSDAIFYGCPDIERRGFKAACDAHGAPMNPETESRLASSRGLEVVRNFLKRRFPKMSEAPCVETRVCQYENTHSGDFLIDRHPQSMNTWIVGGGSGHGFKHGPAVGSFVASLLSGHKGDSRFTLEMATAEAERSVH